MIIPIGHDQSLRRIPWLTVAIMALCVAVQLRASSVNTDEVQSQIDHLQRVVPSLRMGYRPADGMSPRMVLYAFAHGGWLHLMGNLLFLWLVGCNLEDRWGRVAFGAFYLVCAWGAALTFRLVHPGSEAVLIGASGAIAAAMGAFLVNFHDAEIRFAYLWLWLPPRWGTFEAQAMFAMPLWFLQDVLSLWFYEGGGTNTVAYSAHVGGFVLGVAIALGLRYSGIEQKRLIPAASKGVEWTEDPDVVRALELPSRSQHLEAIALLRPVMIRSPRHATAALELVRSALATEDQATVKEFLDRAVSGLWRDGRKVDLVDLAAVIDAVWPRLPWSEASLASVARSQISLGYLPRAEHNLRRLMAECSGGLQEARVRHELAEVLEETGQYAESQLLAETLIIEFPEHPLTPAARERVARLGGQPDRSGPEQTAKAAIARGGVELPPK